MYTLIEMILKCKLMVDTDTKVTQVVGIVWLLIIGPWSLESQVALVTDLSKNSQLINTKPKKQYIEILLDNNIVVHVGFYGYD